VVCELYEEKTITRKELKLAPKQHKKLEHWKHHQTMYDCPSKRHILQRWGTVYFFASLPKAREKSKTNKDPHPIRLHTREERPLYIKPAVQISLEQKTTQTYADLWGNPRKRKCVLGKKWRNKDKRSHAI